MPKLKREKSSGLGAGGQSRAGNGALGWVPNLAGRTSRLCRRPAHPSRLSCTTSPAAGSRAEPVTPRGKSLALAQGEQQSPDEPQCCLTHPWCAFFSRPQFTHLYYGTGPRHLPPFLQPLPQHTLAKNAQGKTLLVRSLGLCLPGSNILPGPTLQAKHRQREINANSMYKALAEMPTAPSHPETNHVL